MSSSLNEQLPIFSHLSPAERELFERRGRRVAYPAGAYIFREGDAARFFWVLLSGQIEVVKAWGDGQEKLLQVMAPGDFIGELGVVFQNHTRTASARAAGPVTLIEVPLEDLERLLQGQSNVALPVMREAVKRFLRTENTALEDLADRNRKLSQSLLDLEAAQEQLIQQEKLAHELSMARQIQEAFLPRQLPALPGWEIAVHWAPANEVSGDFYDFVSLPCGRTALVVGDVAGKGMPAALVMAVTRSIIRATLRSGGQPGELLAQINELLVTEMPPAMFVTAFLALVEPLGGEIEFANAGHCLPVRCCPEENAELRARGLPLGLMPGAAYEEGQVRIAAGGWVLFYSDALSEAHSPERQMFGMPRLHQAARRVGAERSAAGLVDKLVDQYEQFTGPGAEQEDDLTLIVLRRKDGL